MRSFSIVSVSLTGFSLLFLASIAFAWTGPSQAPTGGNVSAPVNVGATTQIKNGALGVNTLAVYGNALMSGDSRYLNFGTIPTPSDPSTGYGFRDNGGTIQYKNSGGSWTSLTSSGGWTVSGNDIYNSNSGNVGVGYSSPSQKLAVNGTVLATAFVYSSDARLKDGVSKLRGALAKALSLSPVSFTWNERAGSANAGKSDIGFIAQDVERVAPELVITGADGMKSVDYVKVVPILVGALQEQQREIDALKADIAALKAE